MGSLLDSNNLVYIIAAIAVAALLWRQQQNRGGNKNDKDHRGR